VTPIAMVAESCAESDYTPIALAMDRAAKDLGIDFIGAFQPWFRRALPVGT